MKKIIGYYGKTLEELKVVFHCQNCGCDFESDYKDYTIGDTSTPSWSSYCPSCNKKVYKVLTRHNDGLQLWK